MKTKFKKQTNCSIRCRKLRSIEWYQKSRETIPLRSRPNTVSQEFFHWILSWWVPVSKESPFDADFKKVKLPWWQNAPRRSYKQKCYEKLIIGPLKKSEPFLFQNLLFWVHFVTNLSWLFRNLYRKRILLISIMTIFNEKNLGFLGPGLKFVVVSRIGFMANFHNNLELNIKMQQELFHWLRNAKQLNIWNLTKENEIHETKADKNYETKRNFTFDETKRNETKFRCLFCFAKQAKFRETVFCFALFRVSRNKKKDAKWKP
jgi:hypothetical protein